MKQKQKTTSIQEATVEQVINDLTGEHGELLLPRIEKGVLQTARLWQAKDGTSEEFAAFCNEHFIASDEALKTVFDKLMVNYEILEGHMLKVKKDLMRPLHLDQGTIHPVDVMFGSYEPGAHMKEDFFANRIAFLVALNFPYFTLQEKTDLGPEWNRLDWAYARVGDLYHSRVPAALIQDASTVKTEADNYIAQYNIYMGRLVTPEGETLFPEDLRLISHWGLRDELKSNYSGGRGLEKQQMIYTVMQRIIDQSIPEKVINNNAYQWDPAGNILFENGTSIEFTPEPDTRYLRLLNNFRAYRNIDSYYPDYPTYIRRQFELNMEIPKEEVEKMFTGFVSSQQVAAVADLISDRLGRNLEPFDIWYNGFKASGSYSEKELDKIVGNKYPSVQAFQDDLSHLLLKLGFSQTDADFLAAEIKVEGSRGAGHAWGGAMKEDKALLRTRIGAEGMDYKGFNIAVHEFGHNVEQTISLHLIDHYILRRVPNTAFTEALAFVFQKRDMELLGIRDEDPMKDHMLNLDVFWGSYEIMGVSLVDMRVWEWLYANPEATPGQLKEAVIRIAKEVWNHYYAPVFGSQDEPILAIYSHMISNPLYLSNYPLGHLIELQIEQYLEGRDFAAEIIRMFSQGSIIPQAWMKGAVGTELSIQPTLEAASAAVKAVREDGQ
ncbi:MAG: hypothetical protein ACNA7V_02275 [Bacteroidales bacterium]